MAVAFTTGEKARITGLLLDTAEELFTTQGLKKTSLDELVAAAGIAKGSFYAFFDSKESLYLEVMLRRAPRVAARVTEALTGPPGLESLIAVMRAITDVLTGDPLYRRLLTRPDELEAVTRRVGPEQIARVTPQLVTPLLDHLAAGQRAGVVVADIPPETLVGVIRAAGLIVVDRDRFGPAYEQVLDATITILARGMLA
ncbi:TetR/AcrR family transcriptional regulator [Nonomuraea gerenzanensis]|uniref:Transcriptional regulator, TetR family n=1 Tax=Nonomuraea gerenzanensis TaxID=93944 RepID=A0A1M4EEG7_9ACTN|nr:TetR/AcrR family transcriptional regulator [Nonomuraea gerenzanensis]UBU08807.1 TetR/AcrR family transcriptional regulator [Nonomuraea gerenzanensis]SBO97172.1 Transcriptional regulator, TetR family [Nonomuraea gerenzanensis]